MQFITNLVILPSRLANADISSVGSLVKPGKLWSTVMATMRSLWNTFLNNINSASESGPPENATAILSNSFAK